jgi:hypothetical protein
MTMTTKNTAKKQKQAHLTQRRLRGVPMIHVRDHTSRTLAPRRPYARLRAGG